MRSRMNTTDIEPRRPPGRHLIARIALFVVALLGAWAAPDSAWALQSHGPPEGLYSHQFAHTLFALSMGVLAYWLQTNRFVRERGWRLIQISCVLFLLWNITAFAGHFVETKISGDLILGRMGSWDQRLVSAADPFTEAYCILKLDHFVCVPAILCLFFGIRSLYKQALLESARSGK